MEKFSILCTLSALLVFLTAALGVTGVHKGKVNDLPFGSNSVEQVQTDAGFASRALAASSRLDVFVARSMPQAAAMNLVAPAGAPVEISGDLLISF